MQHLSSKLLFFNAVFMLLLFVPVYGQVPEEYNELKRYILADLAANDIGKAFAYTDTLQKIAANPEQKSKAEMVRAVLYYQTGAVDKALSVSIDAEKAFAKAHNYTEQIKAIGFIASNFRELGLNSEALYYLDKAIPLIIKLPDGSLKGQYGALLNHEKAGIYTEKEKFDEAAQYIRAAYKYVEQIEIPRQKAFFLATTMYLDAKNNYHLKKYGQASTLLDKAYETLGTKNDLLYGQIQLTRAQIYLADKDYQKAKTELDVVGQMVESSQYFPLKKEYYKTSSEYYKTVNDTKMYLVHYKLYLDMIHADERRSQKIADDTLTHLRQKIQTEHSMNDLILLTGIAVLLLLSFVVYIMYRQNKKRNHHFNEIINKLREGTLIAETTTQEELTSPGNQDGPDDYDLEDINISEDTEKRLHESLQELAEGTVFFLDSNLTLTKLATKLGTNTRYMTYVIRKYHHKNFNNYINDLRIYYILKKLQDSPEYLQYKISYLAQESGFSNHSKFSQEFKRVVGLTPSVFIKQVASGNKNKTANS